MPAATPAPTVSSMSDTDRINALERTTVSLEGTVGTLVETTKAQGLQIHEQGEQMKAGFAQVNQNLTQLAGQIGNVKPGVSVVQALMGVVAAIAAIGTLAAIFGGVVTGILFLAGSQASDVAAAKIAPIQVRLVEAEKAVAISQEDRADRAAWVQQTERWMEKQDAHIQGLSLATGNLQGRVTENETELGHIWTNPDVGVFGIARWRGAADNRIANIEDNLVNVHTRMNVNGWTRDDHMLYEDQQRRREDLLLEYIKSQIQNANNSIANTNQVIQEDKDDLDTLRNIKTGTTEE